MTLQISKYCTIANGEIRINDELVFSDKKRDSFKEFAIEAYKNSYITYPKFFKMDNLSKLGFLTSELILREQTNRDEPKTDFGVVLMNSSSSLYTDIAYQQTINLGENYFPSPSIFVYTLPNIVNGEICIRNKIMGENIFFVSENFDSIILYNNIKYLFQTTPTKKALTGWIEVKEESFFSFLMLLEVQEDVNKIIFEPDTINNLFNKYYSG